MSTLWKVVEVESLVLYFVCICVNIWDRFFGGWCGERRLIVLALGCIYALGWVLEFY